MSEHNPNFELKKVTQFINFTMREWLHIYDMEKQKPEREQHKMVRKSMMHLSVLTCNPRNPRLT